MMKNRWWLGAIGVAWGFALGGSFWMQSRRAHPATAQPNPATSRTVGLIPFRDPWTAAQARYRDIDDNPLNDFYVKSWSNEAFKYSAGQVALTYDSAPAVPFFVGHIQARGLKPNFAYQLKLAGKPANGAAKGSRGWGEYGDDLSNERLGKVGRWWCESWHSRETHFDNKHFEKSSKKPRPKRATTCMATFSWAIS